MREPRLRPKAATEPRRGTPADLLVVGLGNPGRQYAGTRHNVGAEVVELLARRGGESLRRSKELAVVAERRVGTARLALAVPLTYYNEAGQAARLLVRRHGIEEPDRLLVVHDELDLPTGKLRLKRGGGLAGNNGLRSLQAHLHHADFCRLRIGIGKPPGQGADWVLSRPSKAERVELDVAVERAADAVELILDQGVDAAMQQVNRNDL